MFALPFLLISGLAFGQDAPVATTPEAAAPAAVPVTDPVAASAETPAPVVQAPVAAPSPDPALRADADRLEKSVSQAKQAVDAAKDNAKLRAKEIGVAKAEVKTAVLKLKAAEKLLKAKRVAGPVAADAPERNGVSAAERAVDAAKHKARVVSLASTVAKAELAQAKARLAAQEAQLAEANARASVPPASEEDLLKLAGKSAKAEGAEAKASFRVAALAGKLATRKAN
jgi:hypothetical protein